MIRYFLFVTMFVLTIACAKRPQTNEVEVNTSIYAAEINNGQLLWEIKNSENKLWSQYFYDLYSTELFSSYDQSQDISRFCPAFANLKFEQKSNVWGILISALVLYESNFQPTARMIETSLGLDPITGKTVASEGLLQLSYQDKTSYPFCAFDWEKDKYLNEKDPQKTILDPFINLNCGMRILAQQIRNKKKIVLANGAYWAVLKENSPYQRISDIETHVRSLKFCQ